MSKTRSALLALAALVLLSMVQEKFWTRVDRWRFPWGYAESGRPTLTGGWVGALTTGSGARRALLVEMRLTPLVSESERGRNEQW